MSQLEHPDSIPRLEYPSPKLGLGLESENHWTRDPKESKITVKMGKNYHFLDIQKDQFFIKSFVKDWFHDNHGISFRKFNQIDHNCSNLNLDFIIWAQNG